MVVFTFKTSVIVTLTFTVISIVLFHLPSPELRKFPFLNFFFWSTTKLDPDLGFFDLVELSIERFRSETYFGPSSIWCLFSDSKFNESYCKIEHLCLKADTEEYLFVWHPNQSTYYPAWLQSTTQRITYGHLSSVLDHNRYDVSRLVSVPWDKLGYLNDRPLYSISGSVLLMSRFKPDNLLHMLHDDVLPLLVTIREQNLDYKLKYIFFDDHWDHTLGQLFFQILSPNMLYMQQFPQNSIICFETAYIGLSRSSVWYQYGFKTPQGPVTRNKEELTYIRNNILRLKKQIIDHLHISRQCPEYFTLVIARSRTRKILNLSELLDYLRSKHGPVRIVEVTNCANESELLKLLPIVLCTNTLVAMHGSELILSMFLEPGSRVVELFPYGIEPDKYSVYRTLTLIMRQQYVSWVNSIKSNAHFHADDYPAEWGGLKHLSDEDRRRVEQEVDHVLEPHLCCDNPHWLYRIYQDTVVDVNTLHSAFVSSHTSTLEIETTLQLSEVWNTTCRVDANQTHLSWMPPWNLNFISSITSVKYEILVQPMDSNEGVVVVSTGTSVKWSHQRHTSLHCNEVDCLVWVRALITTTQYLRVTSDYNSHATRCTRSS